MAAEAHCLHRTFEASPSSAFCVPRHYLLYATSGRLRLSFEHRTWTLPPARAALVAASTPIEIELPGAVVANSVLFDPAFAPPPAEPLSVFEVSALVRELLLAGRSYASPDESLDEEGRALFHALRVVAWRLAQSPSPAVMPQGRSRPVVQALIRTAADLVCPPSFEELAAAVGATPRSLSRRFSSELGMGWRESLQRMRMIRAVERLVDEPDVSISEIANHVGYGSLSAFNAAFRTFSGKTPTQWRRSFGERTEP